VQKVAVEVESARAPISADRIPPAVVVPASTGLAAHLRHALMSSLRDAGLGLTERPLDGDVLLCVQAIGGSLGAGVARSPEPCRADQPIDPAGFGPEAVALAQRALAPPGPALSVATEEARPPNPPRFGFGAFGGLIARSELGADPALGLFASLGR
jgi:sirohydrochlorin ferrochelatase